LGFVLKRAHCMQRLGECQGKRPVAVCVLSGESNG